MAAALAASHCAAVVEGGVGGAMGALAPLSHWHPEDDLLLKNAVEVLILFAFLVLFFVVEVFLVSLECLFLFMYCLVVSLDWLMRF